jgi:hypothetical protein
MAQQIARRVPVTLFIGEADKSVPFGKSRDISTSGIFVETTARPPVGSIQVIWFVWGEEVCTSKARIVRHERDGVALTFEGKDPGFEQALKEITGTMEHKIPDLSKP